MRKKPCSNWLDDGIAVAIEGCASSDPKLIEAAMTEIAHRLATEAVTLCREHPMVGPSARTILSIAVLASAAAEMVALGGPFEAEPVRRRLEGALSVLAGRVKLLLRDMADIHSMPVN